MRRAPKIGIVRDRTALNVFKMWRSTVRMTEFSEAIFSSGTVFRCVRVRVILMTFAGAEVYFGSSSYRPSLHQDISVCRFLQQVLV